MKFLKFVLAVAVALLMGMVANAADFPSPMSPPRLVNDFAGIFTREQNAALEKKLVDFANESSTQIAVVTLSTLGGTPASSYAPQLFEKWGIGASADKNNGILILVKPKSMNERGEVFISVGYGLEGVVPDILAGRIVNNEMLPKFRNNDYYRGVDAAVDTLISLTRGEFTADQYMNQSEGLSLLAAFVVFIIMMVVVSIIAKKNNKGGGGGHTISSAGDTLLKGVILGSLLSGGRSGGFGGRGGFGGGGFGGFGGGQTGGGGAGGSW